MSTHARPDIARLLERRARHGLTYRELSEKSGIPIPTLAYWAAKFRREAEDPPHFVPVDVVEDQLAGAVTIDTDSVLRVVVEPGFDGAHLARVLSVLTSQCWPLRPACDLRVHHAGGLQQAARRARRDRA